MAPETSPEDRVEVTARLRRILRESGFERVGIAPITGPGVAEAHFLEWLERGHAADMAWLARNPDRRIDPRNLVPGARHVIVLASPYSPARSASVSRPDATRAEIASYARGEDYHRVLERRLRAVTAVLMQSFDAMFRWYVDTGPVLEKAWAERAGIGWIGKNTCSIHPQEGSYYFLSTLITDLDLVADEPANDRCGSCRLCLDACPTDAFPEPYVLDARRCISYWTIEHRGAIPRELAERFDNLVFGCDICQEVCPFNRERGPAVPPAFEALSAREENQAPALVELLGLDAEAFRARFPRSAVRRAGPRGFLRNVLIAIGNSGHPGALEALERPEVRALVGEDLLSTWEDACARLRDGTIADSCADRAREASASRPPSIPAPPGASPGTPPNEKGHET